MARREFSKDVRRAAVKRAAGFCEGILADGCRCRWPLSLGKWAIDHIDPDGLTGEPTLANAQVLCVACHLTKTREDVKRIAEAKRREDKHLDTGTRRQSTLKGPGFKRRPRRHSATAPLEKQPLPRRSFCAPSPERSS